MADRERANLLRALEQLAKVAELKSLTRAAEAVGVTQTAVSHQIKALERSYKTALLHRDGHGAIRNPVELTPEGQVVVDAARRILDEVARIETSVADLKGLVTGRLVVGASYTVAEQFLPKHIAGFHEDYPGVALELRVDNTPAITKLVEEGDLSFGVVGLPSESGKLEVEKVFPDELVAFVSSDHLLLRRADIAPSALSTKQFVLRERGSATRKWADRCLERGGCVPGHVIELGTNEAVKRAVEAGLGVGILSKHAIRVDLMAGVLAKLELKAWACERDHYLVYRHDRMLTRAEDEFLKHIRRDRN